MNYIKYIIVGSISLLSLITFCSNLSENDYLSIQKQKRTETILYEYCFPDSMSAFTLMGAAFNRFIDKNWFIGGEALGAVTGGRGGYAVGAFQTGLQYSFLNSTILNTQIIIGGSGGGGVPVKGGIFIEPYIALAYHQNSALSIQIGFGKYLSLDNNFTASCFDAGICYEFYQLFLPINENK